MRIIFPERPIIEYDEHGEVKSIAKEIYTKDQDGREYLYIAILPPLKIGITKADAVPSIESTCRKAIYRRLPGNSSYGVHEYELIGVE